MSRPIDHELTSVWITADGEKFFDEDKAKEHQKEIIAAEKEEIKEEIKELKKRLEEYDKSSSNTYGDNVSVKYEQK